MGKKEITEKINFLVKKNISQNEIYNELKSQLPSEEYEWLVKRILSIPTNTNINKCDNIRIILISFEILCAFVSEWFNHASIFIVVSSYLFAIVFIYGFLKNSLLFYDLFIVLSFLGLSQSFSLLSQNANIFIVLFDFLLRIIPIYTAIVLRRKLFPGISMWGNIREKNGAYHFDV